MARVKEADKPKLRAAMKQVRSFFLAQGIPCIGKKQSQLIDDFSAMSGLVIDGNPVAWIIGLWASSENSHVFRVDVSFYTSSEWAKTRKIVLKRFGTICMKCGRAGAASVDHIKPRSLFPALSLDVDNLQVLCLPCNSSKGNRGSADYRPALAVSAS